MSTKSLFTSESFRALSVTSAGETQRSGGGTTPCSDQSCTRLTPTCSLLFLDGWGQRRVVLHPRGYNNLRARHGDHGWGGGRHGNRCFLDGLLRGFRGDGDSTVLVQLPLYRALDLSAVEEQDEWQLSTNKKRLQTK